MKRKASNPASRYQAALRLHLQRDPKASVELAKQIGREALAAGLQTLDLSILHEKFLIVDLLPGVPARKRAALIKRAGIFFAATIAPNRAGNTAHLNKSVQALSVRTVELAAANRKLTSEISKRKAGEKALKQSERHYTQLLKESDLLQKRMRQLSRQVLSAHEDERKRISRELHDVIAHALTTINLRLTKLQQGANLDGRGLERNIASTQRLVEKSVDLVHRFARELRPALLDDLGLIPALHAFLKTFTRRTGVRTHLTAFRGLEKLDTTSQTVLFRVAQEALTNVARHAQANLAEITFSQQPDGVCMIVKDDGKSFQVDRVTRGGGNKCLGLLGMRERLEMIGGSLNIESAPGQGTSIKAIIPPGKSSVRKRKEALSGGI
jgi:signal transduction histidine kinase